MNPISSHKIYDSHPIIEGTIGRRALHSPIASNTECFSELSKLNINLDSIDFEFEILDKNEVDRLNYILENYIVKGENSKTWLNRVLEKVGLRDVETQYLVGSAAHTFVPGQEKLESELEKLKHKIPIELYNKIAKKIAKRIYNFKDVDFRIKVKENFKLDNAADELKKNNLFKVTYFEEDNNLLISLGEEDGPKIDFFVHSRNLTPTQEDHAFNLDNLRINLITNRYESKRPGWWWCGHVLKIITQKKSTNEYLFERLLNKEIDSYTTTEPSEAGLMEPWLCTKYTFETDASLRTLLRKIRTQHILIAHCKEIEILTSRLMQASQVHKEVTYSRFMHTFFVTIQTDQKFIPYAHALMTCIFTVALCEGWKSPFEVKLVRHEDAWYLRVRFPDKSEKEDLLILFNPAQALQLLKKLKAAEWPHFQRLIHSLWYDGIQIRTMKKEYRRKLNEHIKNDLLQRIKELFLHGIKLESAEKFFPAKYQTLSHYLMPLCDDPKELLWLGLEVLEHYDRDPEIKRDLCWEAVNQCINNNGCDEAAKLIAAYKKEGIDPAEGYESFFMGLLNRNCNAAIVEVCNPYNIQLSWGGLIDAKVEDRKKKFLELIDKTDISAEEYIAILDSGKMKPIKVQEGILLKIMTELDSKSIPNWIEKYDDTQYTTDEYCNNVSRLVMTAPFKPLWIAKFLKSKRFKGDIEALCTFLISQNIPTEEKSTILKQFKITDNDLWGQIAGEYLRFEGKWPETFIKNSEIPPEILTQWITVIEKANVTEEVIPLIQSLKNTFGLKKIVLIHLLKNWNVGWNMKNINPTVLTLLDPGEKKLPWANIIGNTAKDILKKLQKSGSAAFNIYSSLMCALKPQEPDFFNWWISKVDKLEFETSLKLFEKRTFKECLMLNPKGSLNFLKKIVSPNRIRAILEIPKERDDIDSELFRLLLLASFEINDNGETTDFVLKSSPTKKLKDPSLVKDILIHANHLLFNPKGKLSAVILLWDILPEHINPEIGPSDRLLKLIKMKKESLVCRMLQHGNEKALKMIEPKVYIELLKKLNTFEQKIDILIPCKVTSDALKMIWEKIANDPDISKDTNRRILLIPIARNMNVNFALIQNIALNILSNIKNNIEINLEPILDLLPITEGNEKLMLWNALQGSRKIPDEKLWTSAIEILNNNLLDPPVSLVIWLLRKWKKGNSDILFALLQSILPNMTEDVIQMAVKGLIKNKAINGDVKANQLFWQYNTDTILSKDELIAFNATEDQKILQVKSMVVRCTSMKLPAFELYFLPIAKNIFESKQCDIATHFTEILQIISDRYQKVRICKIFLENIDRNTPLNLIKKVLAYTIDTLSIELSEIIHNEQYNELCHIVKLCTFKMYMHLELIENITPVLKKAFVTLRQSKFRTDPQFIYICTLLLYQKFDAEHLSISIELDLIAQIFNQIISAGTPTAIETSLFILLLCTQNILYLHPESLASFQGFLVKECLAIYPEISEIKNNFKPLFRHLFKPPGGDVDVFLGLPTKNVHKYRLELIHATIQSLLNKHPDLIVDLIQFVHVNLIDLYTKDDYEIWNNLISLFCQESAKQGLERVNHPFRALTLLLLQRPPSEINSTFIKLLRMSKLADLADYIQFPNENVSFPNDERSEFFPILAFLYHMRRCELKNYLLLSDIPETIKKIKFEGNLKEFLKGLSYCPTIVENFPAKSIVMKKLQGLLDFIENKIEAYPQESIGYLFNIMSCATKLPPAYKFEIGMAVAKIFRKELTSLEFLLHLLGGEKSEQINAQVVFQSLKSKPDTNVCFPLKLVIPFIEGNFSELIEVDYFSPIFSSNIARNNFYTVYLSTLKGIITDDTLESPWTDLLQFRNITDNLLACIQISEISHVFEIIELICKNSCRFIDVRVSAAVLELLLFNIRHIMPSVDIDKIFAVLSKAMLAAFINGSDNGPNDNGLFFANNYQIEVHKYAHKLLTERQQSREKNKFTEGISAYLGIAEFVIHGNVSKNSLQLITIFIDAMSSNSPPRTIEWYKFWKTKLDLNLMII